MPAETQRGGGGWMVVGLCGLGEVQYGLVVGVGVGVVLGRCVVMIGSGVCMCREGVGLVVVVKLDVVV